MKKLCLLIFGVLLFSCQISLAQMSSLNQAKYITTLKVIVDHKLKDKDLEPDVDKLREYDKFHDELVKMIGKLNNSRPNEATNKRVMRILEKAGKDIYDILK